MAINLLLLSAAGSIIKSDPYVPIGFTDDPDYGFRGVDYSVNFGTTGGGVDYDILVDSTGGGDYTTVAAAVAAAGANDVIAIKGDGTKYREKVTLKNNLTVQAYGTDRPEITGYDLLGSGTLCTSPTDDGVLGATLAGSGQVYKWTSITDTGYDYNNHAALNVRVNGVPYYLVMDRAQTYSDGYDRANSLYPFRVREDDETYHVGDSYASGVMTDASVINSTNYTNAELTAAQVMTYQDDNRAGIHAISAANVTSNTITISGSPDVTNVRYGLINVAKSLVAGTFFFVDNGGSYDLYVHLGTDTADNDKVEVSTREVVFDLPTTTPTNITIRGLHLSGASGDLGDGAGQQGACVRRESNGSTGTGITIENCLITDSDCTASAVCNGVWIKRCDNLLVNQCTFRDMRNGNAFWSDAGISAVTVDNNKIRRCVIERAAFSPFRWYRNTEAAALHNMMVNCGHKAHANFGNNYIDGGPVLFWGNEWTWNQGYLTSQNQTSMYAYFNYMEVIDKYDNDRRKIHTQGLNSNSVIEYVNNTTLKVPANAGGNGALAITCGLTGDRTDATKTWKVINNIADGLFAPATPSGTVTEASNLVTQLGWDGAKTTVAGDYAASSTYEGTVANVYADAANRDWSPASGSAPQLTITPQSVSSEITNLISVFANVTSTDFDIDCFGNTINKASPAVIGADQALSF